MNADELWDLQYNHDSARHAEEGMPDLFSRVEHLWNMALRSTDKDVQQEARSACGDEWSLLEDYMDKPVFDTALENVAAIRELMQKLLDAASKRKSE